MKKKEEGKRWINTKHGEKKEESEEAQGKQLMQLKDVRWAGIRSARCWHVAFIYHVREKKNNKKPKKEQRERETKKINSFQFTWCESAKGMTKIALFESEMRQKNTNKKQTKKLLQSFLNSRQI